MVKIAFLGAGSTIFARNVLGDAMCTPVLRDAEISLYDIDGERLRQSEAILGAINKGKGGKAGISSYLGPENRKAALKGAD
ncbi:MAG: alpha-glucosidase/alpha-galactosidase, partial [Treponema sp.]|nr:alpha-glucosidase/alpha-galactosidase [Treponema sp.]